MGSYSYISRAGVLGERDLKKRKQGIPLLFLGTNWTRAVVFAIARYLYTAELAKIPLYFFETQVEGGSIRRFDGI